MSARRKERQDINNLHRELAPISDAGWKQIDAEASRTLTRYPAALGVTVAHPDKEVVDIDGDGSFLMNIQELATANVEKIAAKAIILNNQHLGMVVQWEDKFYQGNRGHTYLGNPDDRAQIYPDYVRVCNSFNVKCERVMYKKDLKAAIQRMLDAKEPYELDVIVPYTEHVLPFIPAGRTVADMIY